MQVAWGGYLSDEDKLLSNYYLYKSICHFHYSDCASYKSMSSLEEQSLLSSVSQLSRSPSPPLSPSGFMCIIMLSMTYGTTVSFQIFFQDIFNMFPVSLLVVLYYKSHQFICNSQQFLEVHTCCDVFMCESL